MYRKGIIKSKPKLFPNCRFRGKSVGILNVSLINRQMHEVTTSGITKVYRTLTHITGCMKIPRMAAAIMYDNNMNGSC